MALLSAALAAAHRAISKSTTLNRRAVFNLPSVMCGILQFTVHHHTSFHTGPHNSPWVRYIVRDRYTPRIHGEMHAYLASNFLRIHDSRSIQLGAAGTRHSKPGETRRHRSLEAGAGSCDSGRNLRGCAFRRNHLV